MTLPVAVRATPAARGRVIDTVVAAFAEDPAFHYFFGADNFREQAAEFAGYLFDRRVNNGVWVIEGGLSVSMWDIPSAEAAPAKIALDVSASARKRIDAFDESVHQLLPSTPHWYLGVVATHPAHSGNRWGRATIAAGLAEAAKSNTPAYLETATEGNVDLYRRSGWQLTAHTNVPIPVWVMRFAA